MRALDGLLGLLAAASAQPPEPAPYVGPAVEPVHS